MLYFSYDKGDILTMCRGSRFYEIVGIIYQVHSFPLRGALFVFTDPTLVHSLDNTVSSCYLRQPRSITSILSNQPNHATTHR